MEHSLVERFNEIKQLEGMLWPLKKRLSVLKELKAAIKAHEAEFAQAISQDFGYRAAQETLLTECFPFYKEVNYVIKHLKKWTKVRRQRTDIWFWPSYTTLQLQALGVIGIIAPWNYPLILSLSPLVAAIAAGNGCMVKISEYTPHFGALLEKIINQNFSHYGIAIVNGGMEVGESFSRLPFDHLLFTGAASIGKKVMAAASENLVPVTLELGGKSPVIIDETIDLDSTVATIMRGKLLNSGQICVAPDYILLPVARAKEFVEKAQAITPQLYPQWQANPDSSCIINQKHWDRLNGLLQDAIAKGATWLPLFSETLNNTTTKFQPGLLLNVTDDMRVMQEEVFGPILPVKTYEDIDQAIDYINQKPKPLTLYGFTRNKKLQKKIVQQTLSGSVCFNQVLVQIVQNRIPFGGVGHSGFGHYRGRFGVETFSKLKPVFYQGLFNSGKLFAPPYGKTFNWMIKWLLH